MSSRRRPALLSLTLARLADQPGGNMPAHLPNLHKPLDGLPSPERTLFQATEKRRSLIRSGAGSPLHQQSVPVYQRFHHLGPGTLVIRQV
jgi:hypothetical protein